MHKLPFVLVLGDKEAAAGSVSVRTRGKGDEGSVPLEDFLYTVYHRLGIDADERLMAPGDRPIDIIRGGKLVKGILA